MPAPSRVSMREPRIVEVAEVTVHGAPERMSITRYPGDDTQPIEVVIGAPDAPLFRFGVRADDLADAWSWLMNGHGGTNGGATNQPATNAPTATDAAPTDPAATP